MTTRSWPEHLWRLIRTAVLFAATYAAGALILVHLTAEGEL